MHAAAGAFVGPKWALCELLCMCLLPSTLGPPFGAGHIYQEGELTLKPQAWVTFMTLEHTVVAPWKDKKNNSYLNFI